MNINFYNRIFKITFVIIILAELLSFWAHELTIVNTIFFFIIIAGTFIISLWKIEYGFWIAATELFMGSFGYAFYYQISSFKFSVRLGIFLVLMLAWLIDAIRTRRFSFWNSKLKWPFILLLLAVIWGVILGILHHHPVKDVFLDANAYLFFGLIFVAFSVINSWEKIHKIMSILFASVAAITLKTLFLLFYFSHISDQGLFRQMYTWIRDDRFGEISLITQNYYRIFLQSQIWSLLVLVICFCLLMVNIKNDLDKRSRKFLWIMGILSSLNVIISFSRSFWLALALVSISIYLYLGLAKKITWKKIGQSILSIIGIAIIDLIIITVIVNISAISLVGWRATNLDESAVSSRMRLLKPLTQEFLKNPIIGSGFATTVTYETQDLRTKKLNGGLYTTYSFEWGYLDIAVKIGLIGLIIYGFFLWKIYHQGILASRYIGNKLEKSLILSWQFAFFALLFTHLTTPYINHPLGIFYIILMSAIYFSPAFTNVSLVNKSLEN